MKTIILSAGYATRLYPLTLDQPKSLLPIGGKPIINYIVEAVNLLPDVTDIYVVTNDKFYNHLYKWSKSVKSRLPVSVLNDMTTDDSNKRGGVGDIAFTIESFGIDDELFVIAGDNFFTFDLPSYYSFYKSKGVDCVCAKELNDINMLRQFAVAAADENGFLTELVEKPREPKSNLAVYASYFYTRETAALFDVYLKEGNNPDAPGYFPEWLYRRKPVAVYKMDGECYDIGTPQMYDEVNRMMRARG